MGITIDVFSPVPGGSPIEYLQRISYEIDNRVPIHRKPKSSAILLELFDELILYTKESLSLYGILFCFTVEAGIRKSHSELHDSKGILEYHEISYSYLFHLVLLFHSFKYSFYFPSLEVEVWNIFYFS